MFNICPPPVYKFPVICNPRFVDKEPKAGECAAISTSIPNKTEVMYLGIFYKNKSENYLESPHLCLRKDEHNANTYNANLEENIKIIKPNAEVRVPHPNFISELKLQIPKERANTAEIEDIIEEHQHA